MEKYWVAVKISGAISLIPVFAESILDAQNLVANNLCSELGNDNEINIVSVYRCIQGGLK